jgi:beta-phosphoglucomutase
MDGVLIDSGAHHRAAWGALLAEIGEDPDPEHWRLTIGRPSEEAVPLLLGRRLSDYEVQTARAAQARPLRRFRAKGHRHRGGGEPLHRRSRAPEGPAGRRHLRLRFDVDHLLVDAGLRRYFNVIVTADDVAYGKPDPEVYLLAAARLRVAPERCLVFEDSLVGLEAARRAGMRAIGVTTAHTVDELMYAGRSGRWRTSRRSRWPAIAHP